MPYAARPRLVASLLVLVLTLVACGSGSGPSTGDVSRSGTSQGHVATASAQSSTAPTAQSEDGSSAESPLGDLLGVPLSDSAASDEYFSQLQRDAERKVAECMLAEGFQYKPFDYSKIEQLTGDLDQDAREYAEQYGFGISSDPLEAVFAAFDPSSDPNAEYLASLSQGEAEAYQTALNGELPDFDASSEIENFQPGGCQGKAFDEDFAFAAVFEKFSSQLEELTEAFEADPRIVDARSGWGTCMSEAGYLYATEKDATSDFERRYQTIVGDDDAFVDEDDTGGGVAAGEVVAGSAGEEFVFGPRTLRPEYQQRVDALAVEERAVATASYDCNAAFREIEPDIQREYEQRFVDEHGAAIRSDLAAS